MFYRRLRILLSWLRLFLWGFCNIAHLFIEWFVLLAAMISSSKRCHSKLKPSAIKSSIAHFRLAFIRAENHLKFSWLYNSILHANGTREKSVLYTYTPVHMETSILRMYVGKKWKQHDKRMKKSHIYIDGELNEMLCRFIACSPFIFIYSV